MEESRNTKEKQLKSFKCTKCNFEKNSQHTTIEIENYPRICYLCDTELRNTPIVVLL